MREGRSDTTTMVILALHSFAAARYDLVQTPLQQRA
jgi:hypothetical protein